MLNIHKFIIISLIANLFLLHMTFCGSAGIKNGNIRGLVLDNNRNGLPGVSVLLVKEGKPPIIRTTISNSKGNIISTVHPSVSIHWVILNWDLNLF